MANILIIDDDDILCETLMDKVERMGHKVTSASTLAEGLEKTFSGMFDVVFLDVWMPDGNGLDVLPKLKKAPSAPEVIIITGNGEGHGAELAIKSGAWDYVPKPFSVKEMILPLIRALQYRDGKRTATEAVSLKRDDIVGNTQAITACLDLVARAVNSDVNVLITGETGTGKELFARAIHDNSPRATRGLVVVDCAALPETLVESLLFGHEKGAFTGAHESRDGLVKQADGGTLFLDEVGELPLSVQKRFLRVLEERRFRPVGSRQEVNSDFRLVSATNLNLDKMVKAGKFRKDLLFRLRSMVIDLPPLRERGRDIKNIAFYYINRFCERYGIGTKGFSPEFVEIFTTYNWPGNVRELVHAMESTLSNAGDESTLFPVHLPRQIRVQLARASVGNGNQTHAALNISDRPEKGTLPDLQTLLQATERQYLQDLVSSTGGNMKEACRISGLPRSTLHDRMKKYGLGSNS